MNKTLFYPQNVIKFCPSCWSEKFNFFLKNRFSCQKCKFVFYYNPVCGVMAIIKDNKWKILMTKRSDDPWKWELDLPWWFVDIGETIEDALKREVKEELNLEITSIKYWKSFPNEYIYKWIMYFPLDFIFECEIRNLYDIVAGDDVSWYAFIDPKKIDINNITSKSLPNIIKEYIKICDI